MNENENVSNEINTGVEVNPNDAVAAAEANDNNAPEVLQTNCGISGVEIKEGDQVVVQIIPAVAAIPATEDAPGSDGSAGYQRVVLLTSLTVEEAEALPEGAVKTYPNLN